MSQKAWRHRPTRCILRVWARQSCSESSRCSPPHHKHHLQRSDSVFPQWGQRGSETDLRQDGGFTEPQVPPAARPLTGIANFTSCGLFEATLTATSNSNSIKPPKNIDKKNRSRKFCLPFPPSFCCRGTNCERFIRSLSQLNGLARAAGEKLAARWVTAAVRAVGKSLRCRTRLSYALNLRSDRLQNTKRERGKKRKQEFIKQIFSWLHSDVGAPASFCHCAQSSLHPPLQSLKFSFLSTSPPPSPPLLGIKPQQQIEFSPRIDLDCRSFAC